MAGSTRGTDIKSWWENRAALRQEVQQSLEGLRSVAQMMASTAGDVRASTAAPAPGDTVRSLTEQADGVTAALAAATQQSARLKFELEGERAAFEQVQQEVAAEAGERTLRDAK